MTEESELWVPPSVRETFRKAPAPQTGDAFGSWAGRDLQYLQMPGGAVLGFDLNLLQHKDFRQMRDHYQVNASLSVLTFMMHQLDWHIVGDNKKQAQEVEDNLKEHWTELIRGISQAYWSGFSPMVIDWENNAATGRVQVGRFKDLVPEECSVNWKAVKGYAPLGHVQPTFYEYDGIRQFVQAPPLTPIPIIHAPGTSTVPIPPENTLWYPLLMENGNYYGRKLLRPAFPSWFFSILMHLFSNRYFERFGEPTPIGRVPFDETVSDPVTGTERQAPDVMLDMLTRLRNRGAIVLPNEMEQLSPNKFTPAWNIEYLESQMRGADFDRYIERLDEEISLSLFTPLLMLRTADVGSNSLGTTHAQMYLWMLNALAGDLKDYIDKHVCSRLRDFNYGPNAPDLKWVPRKLGQSDTETLRAMIVALFQGQLAKPDLKQLGDAIGIDLSASSPPAPVADPNADPNAPKDTRIGRPGKVYPTTKAKPSGGKSTGLKVVARVQQQFAKALSRGEIEQWKPDLGFKRQMQEATGDAEYVEAAYGRIERWAIDAAPVIESAEAFGFALEKLIEHEFV